MQSRHTQHLSVEAENVDFKEENRILSAVPQKGVRRVILEVGKKRKRKKRKGAIKYGE